MANKITTITSVQIPEHKYPHVEVNINDNTVRRYVNKPVEYCRTLCVFRSPKGPDGVRTITGGISEFEDLYGNGSVAEYGQAFLNARQLAMTNCCTLHCLRVTAANSTISNLHIYMRYRIAEPYAEAEYENVEVTGGDGQPITDSEGQKVYEKKLKTEAKNGKLEVYFVAKSDTHLTDIGDLCKMRDEDGNLYDSEGKPYGNLSNEPAVFMSDNSDEPGHIPDITKEWKEIRVLSIGAIGKGLCGDGLSVRLTSNTRLDKSNAFKNYQFTVYESGNEKEIFDISFDPDCIIRGDSHYIDNVINDDDYTGNASNLIRINYNDAVIPELLEMYKKVVPGTKLTVHTFDPFLGIDKDKSTVKTYKTAISDPKMEGYDIITDKIPDEHQAQPSMAKNAVIIQLSALGGRALGGGNDGDFSKDTEKRDAKIERRFTQIFDGVYELARNDKNIVVDASGHELSPKPGEFDQYGDPVYNGKPAEVFKGYPYEVILSKNRCPIDFFLDANYDYNTKVAICHWAKIRHEDFMVYLDNNCSDNLVTKTSGYICSDDYDETTNNWIFSIDSYYGKIKDPYDHRIREVTSTYNLARKLPVHWAAFNGKHIPYAGSKYGIIDSYLPNSVFPLMDESIDYEHMDAFVSEHINYAQINSKGDIIRGTQSTRYPRIGDPNTMSNLTEINNCHVVLDIKKDCEKLLEDFIYNFNEASDIAFFNRRAEDITKKYAAAQVKKISATFTRTDEEAEYGILHLYIEVVHKALVKIIKVDIDVNRNVETT